MGQNEFDIKILKIMINNKFTNFIFCKIIFFEIVIVYFYVLTMLYKINYYNCIYIFFLF